MAENPYGTAVSGFLGGLQTSRAMQRRKRKSEREEELFDLEKEATQVELESKKAEQRRNKALRELKAADHAIRQGQEPDYENVAGALNTLDMDPPDVLAEDYRQALGTLRSAMSGERPGNKNELIAAANRVFDNELNRNVGEKVTVQGEDGQPREITITGKKIRDAVPNPDGDSLMFDLVVTGKDEEGNQHTYNAPMTDNRSAADDLVTEVPMERLARNIKGKEMLVKGINANPQLRSTIEQGIIRAGGEMEGAGDFGTMEIKSGDKIITYATRDGKPVRKLSEAPRWEGDGSGGIDGISSGTFNSISDEVDKHFATETSSFGAPLTPEDKKEVATQAKAEAQRLYVRSRRDPDIPDLTPAEAGRQGIERVMQHQPTIPENEAMSQAEEEYEERFGGGFFGGGQEPEGGKQQWIQQRAQEIREASKPANQGQGGGSSQRQPARSGQSGGGRTDGGPQQRGGLAAQYRAPNGESVSLDEIRETARNRSKTPEQVISDLNLQPVQ